MTLLVHFTLFASHFLEWMIEERRTNRNISLHVYEEKVSATIQESQESRWTNSRTWRFMSIYTHFCLRHFFIALFRIRNVCLCRRQLNPNRESKDSSMDAFVCCLMFSVYFIFTSKSYRLKNAFNCYVFDLSQTTLRNVFLERLNLK